MCKAEGMTPDPRAPSTEISPRDGMFLGNYEHYFSVGRSALLNIRCALQLAAAHAPRRILDLPSGHGRVLRALRAEFAGAEIVACDIDLDAIQFCQEALGAVAVPGHENCWQIKLPGQFDLIWCGSLFTHLDAARIAEFLRFFAAHLSSDGVLLFTMHGRRAVQRYRAGTLKYLPSAQDAAFEEMIRQYEATGFGYHDYPDTHNYGISLSKPVWVTRQIESVPQLRLLMAHEMGWDEHQDVYACVRREKAEGSSPHG